MNVRNRVTKISAAVAALMWGGHMVQAADLIWDIDQALERSA